MSNLFRQAGVAAPQDAQGFVPPRGPAMSEDVDYSALPSTGFPGRLSATGTLASGTIADRRPLRPGVIPGQYGPVTPSDAEALANQSAAARAAASPSPPPSGQLPADAGLDILTARGAALAFDQAARDQRQTQDFIGDANTIGRIRGRVDMSHQAPPADPLRDMIAEINRRRARRVR